MFKIIVDSLKTGIITESPGPSTFARRSAFP